MDTWNRCSTRVGPELIDPLNINSSLRKKPLSQRIFPVGNPGSPTFAILAGLGGRKRGRNCDVESRKGGSKRSWSGSREDVRGTVSFSRQL